MSDTENAEAEEDEAPKKKSKMPLIIGVVLALVLGGGGFFATYSGMIGGSGESVEEHAEEEMHEPEPLPTIAFVEMEPLIVSLSGGSASNHLRFRGHLEVQSGEEENVSTLMPRIMDVLNSYLRAVELEELKAPSAMIQLRAQMLRRIQLVVGEERVKDLLVTEFVLN